MSRLWGCELRPISHFIEISFTINCWWERIGGSSLSNEDKATSINTWDEEGVFFPRKCNQLRNNSFFYHFFQRSWSLVGKEQHNLLLLYKRPSTGRARPDVLIRVINLRDKLMSCHWQRGERKVSCAKTMKGSLRDAFFNHIYMYISLDILFFCVFALPWSLCEYTVRSAVTWDEDGGRACEMTGSKSSHWKGEEESSDLSWVKLLLFPFIHLTLHCSYFTAAVPSHPPPSALIAWLAGGTINKWS